MSLSVEVRGEKELERKIKELGDAMHGREVEKAVGEGARVIRDEASRIAPVKTGNLSRNISVVVKTTAAKNVNARVGPNTKAWYGRLVELGHRQVRGGRRGKGGTELPESVPPHPFLRPAFDTKWQETRDAAAKRLWQEIKKVAR